MRPRGALNNCKTHHFWLFAVRFDRPRPAQNQCNSMRAKLPTPVKRVLASACTRSTRCQTRSRALGCAAVLRLSCIPVVDLQVDKVNHSWSWTWRQRRSRRPGRRGRCCTSWLPSEPAKQQQTRGIFSSRSLLDDCFKRSSVLGGSPPLGSILCRAAHALSRAIGSKMCGRSHF